MFAVLAVPAATSTRSPSELRPLRLRERALALGSLYLVLSSLAMPFRNALWFGELPLLAVPQIPKLALAKWFRVDVVMQAMRSFGWSRGSFSPDYLAARPWGLALACLTCIAAATVVARVGFGRRAPAIPWSDPASGRLRALYWLFVAATILDGLVTLAFANTHAVSMY